MRLLVRLGRGLARCLLFWGCDRQLTEVKKQRSTSMNTNQHDKQQRYWRQDIPVPKAGADFPDEEDEDDDDLPGGRQLWRRQRG